MEYNNNREKALHLINTETHTRSSLCEAMGLSKASMSSVFSYLRLMGHYPMEREDKTLFIGTKEQWEEAQANKGPSTRTPRTPEQAFCAAQKREGRAYAALDKAKKLPEGREAELRVALAQAEVDLAEFLMEKAEQNCRDAGIDISTIQCGAKDDDDDKVTGIEPEGEPADGVEPDGPLEGEF